MYGEMLTIICHFFTTTQPGANCWDLSCSVGSIPHLPEAPFGGLNRYLSFTRKHTTKLYS